MICEKIMFVWFLFDAIVYAFLWLDAEVKSCKWRMAFCVIMYVLCVINAGGYLSRIVGV